MLGEAVLNQLEDVQASIQQVRLQAYMAGMLVTDEQQVVTGSPDLIIVLPADETQIFVPTYDPAAVLAAAPVPLPPVEAVAEAPAEPAPRSLWRRRPCPSRSKLSPRRPSSLRRRPMWNRRWRRRPIKGRNRYRRSTPRRRRSCSTPTRVFLLVRAATFAGGAAIGGLLGYVIGDDDDDDNDWDYSDEDWDDISDDVDDIADDMDELTEGFEDLAEQREETADQLQQRSEERADAGGEPRRTGRPARGSGPEPREAEG